LLTTPARRLPLRRGEKERGDALAIKYAPIAILAGGLALGVLALYGIPQIFPSQTETNWRSEYGEDSSHKRIMAFQDVLKNQGTARDVNELAQQIDVQLKIEELIIQSRAAEYSKLTPFTSLSSSVVTLLIALLSFVAGLMGKPRRAAPTPNP
jgi:hypothetical protein